MAVIRTYHTMLEKIKHIVPTGHAYRERNLAWFLTGIFHSRSVHTTTVANKLVGKAKKNSHARRLSRFLDNGAVRVRKWYRPIACKLLAEAARTGEIRLIIDATKVAQNHQLLMVSLAHRRRSLPIVWTWTRSAKGHSCSGKQAALLQYAHDLMPAGTAVFVTGDSEFTPLQDLLEEWGWYYVLRQKGSHLFCPKSGDEWQRMDTMSNKPGMRVWLPDVQLTQQHRRRCNILAYWRKGEKGPWLLATNLPSARLAIQHYKKRAWIEEMFGDFKGKGADLETSRLRHFLRLSRLTLVVAILYVWVFAFGTAVIKRGDRHLVDRIGRRDLSVFRIGNDMLERCLINELPISIRDVPYFI